CTRGATGSYYPDDAFDFW
nr:immunoglobulin heavy chain junction region [Macaca mulatta]